VHQRRLARGRMQLRGSRTLLGGGDHLPPSPELAGERGAALRTSREAGTAVAGVGGAVRCRSRREGAGKDQIVVQVARYSSSGAAEPAGSAHRHQQVSCVQAGAVPGRQEQASANCICRRLQQAQAQS
jgi:hypothetical protein